MGAGARHLRAQGRLRGHRRGAGVKADDIDITLEDGLLTIQGERQFTSESSEQQYHRVERRYGSFRRSITLPSQVQADAIEASFDNGVLEVLVPKAEQAKPKKITVRAGGGARPAGRLIRTMPPGEGRRSTASPLRQRGHREGHREARRRGA